ncbi:unnamed protein product [Nezara viridula]|uniref:Uncharacterized protein n=1 Tax=Nezara viridula TaxID=85310 RepID=A0A9P0HDN9_NEZVI|nr:unnamed protein product [Nezara viridula]
MEAGAREELAEAARNRNSRRLMKASGSCERSESTLLEHSHVSASLSHRTSLILLPLTLAISLLSVSPKV